MKQPLRAHFDLVDLALFIEVTTAENITRAAAGANMSLPAASMRIKNLERALGVQLLNRTRSGTKVTESGRILEGHAKAILAQVSALHEDLRRLSDDVAGTVSLVSNPNSLQFLPAAIGTFLTDFPAVTIDLREGSSSEGIVQAVRAGTVDFGIVLNSVDVEGLESIPYCDDRMVVVVPRGHPLAARGSIFFAEALEHDLVTLDSQTYNYMFVQRCAAELGRTPTIRAQVGGFDVVCRLIEANVGVGLIPRAAACHHARLLGIEQIELLDAWASRGSLICSRRFSELPSAARALIQAILTYPETRESIDPESFAEFTRLVGPARFKNATITNVR
jgi:DNA-binding transcriptional LysR family regulator